MSVSWQDLKALWRLKHLAAIFSSAFPRVCVCVCACVLACIHTCPAAVMTGAAPVINLLVELVWWCWSSLAEGIDFYYGSKQHAQKMVDFLQCTVPCRWALLLSGLRRRRKPSVMRLRSGIVVNWFIRWWKCKIGYKKKALAGIITCLNQ